MDSRPKAGLESFPVTDRQQGVRPEDRALQGCNLSAGSGSNTAGPGGDSATRAGNPAGSIPRRKIPGGLGDRVPQGHHHSANDLPSLRL